MKNPPAFTRKQDALGHPTRSRGRGRADAIVTAEDCKSPGIYLDFNDAKRA